VPVSQAWPAKSWEFWPGKFLDNDSYDSEGGGGGKWAKKGGARTRIGARGNEWARRRERAACHHSLPNIIIRDLLAEHDESRRGETPVGRGKDYRPPRCCKSRKEGGV